MKYVATYILYINNMDYLCIRISDKDADWSRTAERTIGSVLRVAYFFFGLCFSDVHYRKCTVSYI